MTDAPDTPAGPTRTFVALRLPDAATLALSDAAEDAIERAGADADESLRVVDAAQMHVTLAFLGNLEASAVEAVERALDERCASLADAIETHPVQVRLLARGRAGTLLLHLSPAAREALEHVRAGALTAARAAGARLPERAWLPHVTVLRSRRGSRVPRGVAQRVLEQVRGASWQLSALELVASQLRAEGAEHRVLASWPLDR